MSCELIIIGGGAVVVGTTIVVGCIIATTVAAVAGLIGVVLVANAYAASNGTQISSIGDLFGYFIDGAGGIIDGIAKSFGGGRNKGNTDGDVTDDVIEFGEDPVAENADSNTNKQVETLIASMANSGLNGEVGINSDIGMGSGEALTLLLAASSM